MGGGALQRFMLCKELTRWWPQRVRGVLPHARGPDAMMACDLGQGCLRTLCLCAHPVVHAHQGRQWPLQCLVHREGNRRLPWVPGTCALGSGLGRHPPAILGKLF